MSPTPSSIMLVDDDRVVATVVQTFPYVLPTMVLIVTGMWFFYLMSPSSEVPRFWATLPAVGVKDEWFSWPLAVIRSFKGTKAMAFEGYEKVAPRLHFPW
jgi:hypothetical protein